MFILPLVDAEMCKSAIAHKLELFKQIASVLQGDVKPSEFVFSSMVKQVSKDEHGKAVV